jgi:predicted ferric reductase
MGDGHQEGGFEIVSREDFSEVTCSISIRHPLLARSAKPGQFAMAMFHKHGERIPLTLAGFDREGGTVTLVTQAVGKTTKEMQETCKAGTRLYAVARSSNLHLARRPSCGTLPGAIAGGIRPSASGLKVRKTLLCTNMTFLLWV